MIYTVGEMAQKLGVPASTLRYYDKEGLLPFVERSSGGIRMFRENDFEWLQVIRCMKKAGMSIKDIRQYIELSMQGNDTIDTRLEMFRHQREVLTQQIQQLQHTLETVEYKCWFYEAAKAAGTVDVPGAMTDADVPEQFRAIRQELRGQKIQHSEIQILRPAEDHPIDLNGWGSLQKNSRSAAQRLCKKQIQLSVKLFFNISGQLVRLITGSRVGRFTGSIKAVEADGIHAEFPFQQRDQILKLLPAHKISVQQHHGLSLYIAESFDYHTNLPPRYYLTFMQKSQRSLPRPSVMVLSQISFGCSPV